MKRESLFIILACIALALPAQDAIRVKYKGANPTISDFVTAFVNYRDNEADEDECADEAVNAVSYVWDLHQKGLPLDEGQTLTIDEKNGYVAFENRSEYESDEFLFRAEMCYWNEADGKHKLFAYSVWCFSNGIPAMGQFDGITFFRYDNATKKMVMCDPPGFEVNYFNTAYDMPRTGKDITVTSWDENGNKQAKTLKWDGRRFSF